MAVLDWEQQQQQQTVEEGKEEEEEEEEEEEKGKDLEEGLNRGITGVWRTPGGT